MIEQIQSFVAVVDAGSYSAAGRNVGLSKSTISQRIQQLEQRLGSRLLHRSTRSVRPTDTGRAYYERCVRILAEIAEAEFIARESQVALSGTLRVHLPIELGMYILGGIMADFAAENPSLSLELDLSSRHIDLIEEGYDAAIRVGTMPNSSLISRKILSIPRCLYASTGYLAKNGQPKLPQDLSSLSCLHFHTAYHTGEWILRRKKETVRIKPLGSMIANNLTVLRDAATSGLGIALMPRFLCHGQVKQGTLLPLLTDWQVEDAEVYILYPSRRHLSAKVRGLLTYLDGRLGDIANLVT